MDPQTLDHRIVMELTYLIPGRIRVPTAGWLFSDLFGVVDCKVRQSLCRLKEAKKIEVDLGGWITVK